jgi:hypothetical protein
VGVIIAGAEICALMSTRLRSAISPLAALPPNPEVPL